MEEARPQVIRSSSSPAKISLDKIPVRQVTPPQSPGRPAAAVRPMANAEEELSQPPPRLELAIPPPVVQQPGARRALFPQQEEVAQEPMQNQRIDDILRANEEGRRTNAELLAMIQALLPAVQAQLEVNQAAADAAEQANQRLLENNREARQFQQQIQAEMSEMREQIRQQGEVVGQGVEGVRQGVEGVRQGVEGVRQGVQQVGQDVNLGRQENVANFGIVRQQIDDFRQVAIDNFNEVKHLIRTAGRNAIDGCLPLQMSSIAEFITTFFRCLYYFGVFIIYVFGMVKNFYMDLRERIITIMLYLFGWAPIPNIDRIIRVIWFLFEAALSVTLIDTIGVYFGYQQVGTTVCIQIFNLLYASVLLLFQTVWFVILNNPVSRTIINILDGVGFFAWCNWIIETMKSIKDGAIAIVAAAQYWAPSASPTAAPTWLARGGSGELALYSGLKISDRNIEGYGVVLDNFGNNINQMMDYMHSILTGTKDPNLYKYFDNQESRDLAKTIQSRIALIENVIVTGNLKMLSNSGPTIEEIGGKTRRRSLKKSTNRKSRAKKNKKTKQLRRKHKKHLKSKKSKKY